MKLSSQPQMVNSHDLDVLEKFTVMLYDQSSSESNVDSARRTLFTQKNRPYDKIPPTRAVCLVSTCASCCIPGWIHLGSGACSTCKITTSKRMGLERRRKWDIGERRKWDWTENNPIADVCLAPKKCG